MGSPQHSTCKEEDPWRIQDPARYLPGIVRHASGAPRLATGQFLPTSPVIVHQTFRTNIVQDLESSKGLLLCKLSVGVTATVTVGVKRKGAVATGVGRLAGLATPARFD